MNNSINDSSELKTIQTTCAYCGVGCGVEAKVNLHTRDIIIAGDQTHPSNYGRLCSKGSALGETITLSNRLLKPVVNGKECNWDTATHTVAKKFQEIIAEHGPNAVAFYASGQLLTEDYYVANKLMKGFIGSANIDTNSRLCMSSSVAGHKRAFGSDTVPTCYEDFEHAELIIFIGSNAAWCHPVSFQRIKKAKESNPNLKIVVIDPRKTDTCDIADLHIPLKIGTDVSLFNGLLAYLYREGAVDQEYVSKYTNHFEETIAAAQKDAWCVNSLADKCRVAPHVITTFFSWFKQHNKTLSLYSQGVNQSSAGTDKVNAIINCHLATGRIGKPGMGPFSLTGQPNAMGGREVGGLANQLASHLEYTEQDISLLARFWETDKLPKQPGLTAVDMFDAVANGEIKAIWVMATNPVASLPNAEKVREAIEKCEFVVVSDCVANADTLDRAHVKLPAAGWSEKDGTVTNSERRISRQRALFPLAGDAKPDWWIISEVAKAMGYQRHFNYQSNADIFREHAALSGFENSDNERLRDFDISGLADISDQEYDSLIPIQWPIIKDRLSGTGRMLENGTFFTENRKANFVPTTYRPPVNTLSEAWPLALNTGRIRDQWHSMTRTALAARLNQHKPEPYVEISEADTAGYGLHHGDIAEIESLWGSMLARVEVSQNIHQGEIFMPMHWTSQFSSQGRVGSVVNPEVDPVSFQPESKHTPVSIKRFQTAWHGFIISKHPLILDGIDYVVLIKGDGYFRYELAGKKAISSWQSHIANQIMPHAGKLDWQTYQDQKTGTFRTACFHGQEIQSVLIIGPSYQLPERSWIESLFKGNETVKKISPEERLSVLTGKPPIGTEDTGKTICACFNVGEKTISAAIKKHGLKTAQEVGKICKAGTNCGSCVPEIKELL